MAARSTMTNLIQRVRELTGAGTAEYSIGAVAYWSDDQIQSTLDRNRRDVWQDTLQAQMQQQGGQYVYRTYTSQYQDYEETSGGTAIFIVRDGTGNAIGTAEYSADYERGVITFGSNQGAAVRYLEGRAYDVYAAAAEVLTGWAGFLTRAIDFDTANQSFKASQQQKALSALAAQYQAQAKGYGGSYKSNEWERSDLNLPDQDDAYIRFHRSTTG